jgi:hypothetical protein
MRLRTDERGQTGAELLGGLLIVAVVIAAVSGTGVGTAIADNTSRIVCQIAGGENCGAPSPDPGDPDNPDDPAMQPLDGPTEAAPPLPPGPLVTLPFPGSLSITCTYQVPNGPPTGVQTPTTPAPTTPKVCEGREKGVGVQVTGEFTAERTETKLDDKGCPQVELSISGKLQLELTGKAKGKTTGGGLTAFIGQNTKYKVTVPPTEAEAIENGERQPPNAIDPRSIRAGETVELSEEFYTGHNLEGNYRALQVQMGFEEGRRLSSGVQRVDPNTVRIYVGDSEFVRQALALGLGIGGAGVSIGAQNEMSEGKLRSVDIEITTQEGWDAYQKFMETGKLPEQGAEGTIDHASADTLDLSSVSKLEAKLGPLKLGGVLNDSEGHITETRHQDGRVETVTTSRYNDVGLAIRESTTADGITTTDYSLLIEGASEDAIGGYERLSGQDLAASEDGNVRFDFRADDLREIQEMAMDQLVWQSEQSGDELSREEIERFMREDPDALEDSGFNQPWNWAYEIASAKSPEEVLGILYLFGGPHSHPDEALRALENFAMQTAWARHGLRETAAEHPDSRLPGARTTPDCD